MKKRRVLKRKIKIIFAFLFLVALLFLWNNQNANWKERKDWEKVGLTEEAIEEIVKNKEEYPEELLNMLNKYPDMETYVLDYPTKKGKVFSDTIGNIDTKEVPLLLQYDERWGYGFYGGIPLSINGCGPTSIAMIYAYLTKDNSITPYEIAAYSEKEGYYVEGSGTSWSLITEGMTPFGIIGKEIPLSRETIFHYLEQGTPILASMGKGDFTSTGHFIVFTKIENGKIKINDSMSRERSSRLWDYETLESQIKNVWVFELI